MPGGSPGGGGKPDGAPGPRGRTRRLSPCRALRSAATLLLLLAAGSATEAGAQSVRPHGPWRSVESPHFHLAFRAELEQLVPHALQAAEFAWDSLARALPPPEGRIDLVLDDAHDQANGFGGPFPGNHVILWAAPPVDEPTLAFYDDWWRVLLCHELTHVFALDRTGRLGRIGRAVLGRVPSSWPLFPVIGSPGWAIEGVPVLHESRFTGYGRLHGSWHEMAVRTAILEGRFDPIDRASNAAASWPAGRRPYIYGSLFLGRLAREGGPDAGARLTEAAAAATLPAPVFFDRLGRSALGRNFTEEWRAWQEDLERRYGAWSDSLRALGVTTGERLAGGYFTAHPRVSPDGKTVVFYGSDGRTPAGLHRFDPETGNTRRLCDWHSESPVAWLADGGLLAGRLEAVDAYEERTELVRLDAKGGLRDRLSGERLREPDVDRSGRVVAIQLLPGTTRLVLLDLERKRTLRAGDARLEVQWARPRFSPDGRRIAVERAANGRHDIVLLDDSLRTLGAVTDDRAVDLGPVFSPDGRWLLFSSDRSGVPDLYAADLAGAALPVRRVTRTLTGAFWPDLSPDGRWVYYCGYHADGFHLERIPFDPARWEEDAASDSAPRTGAVGGSPSACATGLATLSRTPSLTDSASAFAADPAPAAATDPGPMFAAAPAPASAAPAARPYRPWRSLLPRYWLPIWTGDAVSGSFYGAFTSGGDLLDRHNYVGWLAANFGERRIEGSLGYTWSGLGNPVLGLQWSRGWSGWTVRPPETPAYRLLEVEDALDLTASLRRVRWRSTGDLTLALEGIRERRKLEAAPPGAPDPRDRRQAGAALSLGYSRVRRFAFSISPEQGVSARIGLRRRWDLDATADGDRGFTEGTASISAYVPLRVSGFARHVVAWRSSALVRDGRRAEWASVGGVSQGVLDLGFLSAGGRRFLPVRGYPAWSRAGTRAFSASVEYRFPLALIERGYRLWPVFLDRLSGLAFVDAGDAWARTSQGGRRPGRPASGALVIEGRALDPLLSAGAELVAETNVFHGLDLPLRFGAAWPLRKPRGDGPQWYVAIGG